MGASGANFFLTNTHHRGGRIATQFASSLTRRGARRVVGSSSALLSSQGKSVIHGHCSRIPSTSEISIAAASGDSLRRGIAGRRAAQVVIGLATIIAVAVGNPQLASAASPACPNGSTMAVVAHEDDSLLFLSPDLSHDIQAKRCVRTVFVTAGDDGQGPGYWLSREDGAEAAYAEMAGVADTWSQSDAGISGHPMPLMTLVGDPQVSLVFMRLPDGDVDGSGFASTDFESLQKLYQGTISEMTTVDGTSSYTKTGLTLHCSHS